MKKLARGFAKRAPTDDDGPPARGWRVGQPVRGEAAGTAYTHGAHTQTRRRTLGGCYGLCEHLPLVARLEAVFITALSWQHRGPARYRLVRPPSSTLVNLLDRRRCWPFRSDDLVTISTRGDPPKEFVTM